MTRGPLRSRALRAAVLWTAVVGGGLALAGRARAQDGTGPAANRGGAAPAAAPASALDALEPGELEAVRRRIPEWDRLPREKQEHVARLVLRLRSLSPEDRERFLARMKALDRAGPVTVERLPDALRDFQKLSRESRDPLVRAHVIARALSAVFVESLPAETRASILAPEGGLGFHEQVQVANALAMAWKRRVVDGLLKAPPLAAETPANGAAEAATAELERLREQVRGAGGASAPEPLRRALAQRVFDARLAAWKGSFERPEGGRKGEGDAGVVLAAGRRLVAAAPDAWAAVAGEASTAAASGRAALLAWAERQQPEASRPAQRARALWEWVFDLEKRRPFVTGEVLEKLDALQVAVLTTTLRVPSAKVATLAPSMPPLRRRALLLEWLREHGPAGGGPGRK